MKKIIGLILGISLIAAVTLAQPSEAATIGVFYNKCVYSHSAPDDPIVHPNMPGMSHEHDFFGAVGVDAFTTDPSVLVGGDTTCLDKGATVAYWAPALFIDGSKILPEFVNVRYAAGGKDRATIQTIPENLKIVAGGDKKTTKWGCKFGKNTNPEFYQNCGDKYTTVNVVFPDCWDGVNLDSYDHRSHMAYAKNVRGFGVICPSTHPVPIPQVQQKIHYPKNLPLGEATLSSGATNTFHADLMDSWVPARLESLIDFCIRGNVNCGEASTGEPVVE